MKRNPEPERQKGLSRTFPLFFWVSCHKCDMEFRREWGWRAVTGPYTGPYQLGVTKHLCSDCAPDFETANDYFLNKSGKKRLPPFVQSGVKKSSDK